MNSAAEWRYLPRRRIELLIALSRLIFASFSLVAVSLDPSQPARYQQLAYGLMAGYVIYSLIIGLVVWQDSFRLAKLAVITHICDLVIFTAFMFFTEGARSPFFAYIIFCVLCATLRWHWRGALYTFILALSAYFALGLYGDQILHHSDFNLGTFIVRGSYLTIVTLLLIHISAQQLRIRKEFAALARWPRPELSDLGDILQKLLSQASAISGAPRLLTFWEEPEEPWVHKAFYSREAGLQMSRESPDAFGELVPEQWRDENFLCYDVNRPGTVVLLEPENTLHHLRANCPISRELQSRYGVRSFLSMHLKTKRLNGRLFLLDKPAITSDDLVMGNMIAARIAEALNEYCLMAELRSAAINGERIHLARDLHDGLLQSLAAIGMKIQSASRVIESDSRLARRELADIGKLLLSEQRDLRCLIQELKPMGGRNDHPSLQHRLEDLAGLIRRIWGLRVEIDMGGIEFPTASMVEREVYFLVREALVNGARHAAASSLKVCLEAKDRHICITVADNGNGFPLLAGEYDLASLKATQAGPGSIVARVGALGGSLTINSSQSGACLRIRLELRGPGGGNGDSPSA